MKVTIFLMSIVAALAISSAAFSQSSPPARDTRTAPVRIEPRPTPGKAPAGPKEVPDAKLSITSLEYVDTLPGARVTVKNVGGKTNARATLLVKVHAAQKTNEAWPGIPPKSGTPVTCPHSFTVPAAPGSGWSANLKTTDWSKVMNPPVPSGMVSVPELKAGQSATMNVKFDRLGTEQVKMSSFVDFATSRSCGPNKVSIQTWSHFKYFIIAEIPTHPGSPPLMTDTYKTAYLHP